MSAYSLSCPETFNDSIDFRTQILIAAVSNIVNDYVAIFWNLGIDTKTSELAQIKEYGLSCTLNVFMSVLMATKNLSAAAHHAKKAYMYYAEFIMQINQDSNSFLRLTATDAILFSYKKTMFAMESHLKTKLNKSEEKFAESLFSYLKIIQMHISICLSKNWDTDIDELISKYGKRILIDGKGSIDKASSLESGISKIYHSATDETTAHMEVITLLQSD